MRLLPPVLPIRGCPKRRIWQKTYIELQALHKVPVPDRYEIGVAVPEITRYIYISAAVERQAETGVTV